MFLVNDLDVHGLYFQHWKIHGFACLFLNLIDLVDGLDPHDINLAILVDDFDFHDLDLMFFVHGLDAYAFNSQCQQFTILILMTSILFLVWQFWCSCSLHSMPKVYNLHLFFNLMVLVDDLDPLDFALIGLVDGFEPLSFYFQCLWLIPLILYMWIFYIVIIIKG